jgi:glycosyltransferase involved in cell wall biosynthesis
MRVLMFGWEFPPHISGGLGTACLGLTTGLLQKHVDVLFVVPKLFGDENHEKFRLVAASDIEIETSNRFYREMLAKLNYIQVRSHVVPYRSPEQFSGIQAEEVSQRRDEPGLSSTRFELSGSYSKNLMNEVQQYALVACRIAKENQYDIIHAHDWLTYPAGIMAREVSGKPLVVHVHATEFDRSGEHINPEVYEIERKGFHEADEVIAVSGFTRQILIDRYDVPPGKITVVHNGVLHHDAEGSGQERQERKEKVVSFLGRITFQKGPDYFIEAARKVLTRFPDVRFIMAGSGDLLQHVVKRVAELRIGSRFYFTGFLKGEEIDRLFAKSDVYVMPSVSEPFGISPLEAARAGVPVIISKQSGVSEVLNHALKVDFWDTDALADAICGLLSYKTLSSSFSREGSREVENLRWEDAAEKIKKVYEACLNN